jgi:DNA-binding NarL/FixJ family response regulator
MKSEVQLRQETSNPLVNELRTTMVGHRPFDSLGLTARETEVLTWIARGKTNYGIGVILSASTGTVCKHVQRILSKLCVENRTAAAAIALAALANAKK